MCLGVNFLAAFLKTSSAWWEWMWLGCGAPITSHPTAGSHYSPLLTASLSGESWEVAPSAEEQCAGYIREQHQHKRSKRREIVEKKRGERRMREELLEALALAWRKNGSRGVVGAPSRSATAAQMSKEEIWKWQMRGWRKMEPPATAAEKKSKNSVLGRALPTIRFLFGISGFSDGEGKTYISEIPTYTERHGFLPCRIQWTVSWCWFIRSTKYPSCCSESTISMWAIIQKRQPTESTNF